MRRMKRWLAMSMAVLIAISTLAGDYLIATAAELPAANEAVEESKDSEDDIYKVDVLPQPMPEVTQEPVEMQMPEETEAPTPETIVTPEVEVTATPEVEVMVTPAPTAENVAEATTTPEAVVVTTPEVTPEAEATATPEVEEDEAVADAATVTISYTVNNDTYGYIEGEDECFETADNEEEVIRGAVAVANGGYVFVNWTDEDGKEVGTNAKFVPAEKVTAEYTANFAVKVEKEIKYPAVDFGSFYVSDMKVTINAPEGAFPEGTVVAVREVSVNTAMNLVEDAIDESVEIAEVKAVDITFTDKGGNEIQPLVPISVLFSQADLEGNSFAVYHADEGEVEKVADLVNADGGAITADSFSMYVLVGTNSVNIGEMASYTMYQGETIKVYAGTTDTNGTFTVTSSTNIITIGDKTTYDGKYPAVEVIAANDRTGEATITYTSGSYVQTIKIVVKQKIAVSFNANGGSAVAPASINAVVGAEVTMPSYTGTRNGYVFVGWCKNADVNDSMKYAAGEDYIIYPASTKYVVDDNVTFSAVWASTQGTDAEFYIRLDGEIPHEPKEQDVAAYSSKIAISDAISVASFYTSQSGVEAHLKKVPSDAQIKAVYPDYNPEKHYVLWYVIKHDRTWNGWGFKSSWHVDGVLLEKEKVNLTYDANSGGVTVYNMPLGEQYTVGATATVSDKVPTRTGYTFDSWNTSPDGSGTKYTGNNTFTINESTTLYAQWVPARNTKYVVQRYDADTNQLIDEFDRNAVTDSVAHVTDADKVLTGYTFVEDHASNKLSGVVAADGSLVLKLYFSRKEITVTITENSGEYTYDGTEKAIDKYTVSISDSSYK